MNADSRLPGVVLIGNGPSAESAMSSLSDAVRLLAVVRSPSPDENGVDPVVRRAGELGIRVVTDTTIAAIDRLVENLSPDAVVISSFHRILPPSLLARSRFVNVHYAPLPAYRGNAPVNWAMINDEPYAAITIHQVAERLDAGNILYQETVPITDDDGIGDMFKKLNTVQEMHLGETVAKFMAGYEGTAQDESRATYGCARIPSDGEIRWSDPTRRIFRLIRALRPPYPGAYTFFDGKRLFIHQAEPSPASRTYHGRIPGRVVSVLHDIGAVDVLTGDGVLRIHRVGRPGESGPPKRASDLIRSVRTTLGIRTIDLLERIQSLETQLASLRAMFADRVPDAGTARTALP